MRQWELFTPLDIERRVGIPTQHPPYRHGPGPALRRSAAAGRRVLHTDRDLWLCGVGTHPGGEVTGAPGHNAAHAILSDLGRRAD